MSIAIHPVAAGGSTALFEVQARKGGGGGALAPWNADPRSKILFGSGNPSISTQQIRAALMQPGMTPQKALDAALTHKVSVQQIANAGVPGYTVSSMVAYIKSQGIPVNPRFG